MITIYTSVSGSHIAEEMRNDPEEAADFFLSYAKSVATMSEDDKQELREAFQCAFCEADLNTIRYLGAILKDL